LNFLIGEINIPIIERNVRGTYKMMLSPAYNDLTKLVMPKAKRDHINSSKAITKYRVLDSNYGVSLVECQPITGRFYRFLVLFNSFRYV
jgi:23S rRNA-/tRNA-specific pseudouridylate synthase